jgi:hypothetical protein
MTMKFPGDQAVVDRFSLAARAVLAKVGGD